MTRRNPILQNFGWKLLAVILATLTWLTIETEFQQTEKKAEGLKEAPLIAPDQKRDFPNIQISLLAAISNTNRYKITPETAEVMVGGEIEALKQLQIHQIQAYVDVSDAQDEKQFRRPILIRVPPGFNVVSVDPTNAGVERITPVR